MMKMNVFDLIETKAYEALSIEEKTFVLKQMTEAEYSRQHNLIQQAKEHFSMESSKLKADEKIRTAAFMHMKNREKTQKRRTIPPILRYRIPVWAAAAIFLVLFMALSYQYFSDHQENKMELLSAKSDTVYLERILTDTLKIFSAPDTIFMTDITSITNTYSSSTTVNDQVGKQNGLSKINPSSTGFVIENEFVLDLELGQKYSGTSLRDDSIAQMLMGIRMM